MNHSILHTHNCWTYSYHNCIIDGSENLHGKVHRLQMDVTEVGRDRSVSPNGQYLQVMSTNSQS